MESTTFQRPRGGFGSWGFVHVWGPPQRSRPVFGWFFSHSNRLTNVLTCVFWLKNGEFVMNEPIFDGGFFFWWFYVDIFGCNLWKGPQKVMPTGLLTTAACREKNGGGAEDQPHMGSGYKTKVYPQPSIPWCSHNQKPLKTEMFLVCFSKSMVFENHLQSKTDVLWGLWGIFSPGKARTVPSGGDAGGDWTSSRTQQGKRWRLQAIALVCLPLPAKSWYIPSESMGFILETGINEGLFRLRSFFHIFFC